MSTDSTGNSPPPQRPGFDRVAGLYPQLERLVYGRKLERGRLAFLPELTTAKNLLLLGEGNGRFLQKLLDANPSCTVTVVEISPRMIAHARKRLTPAQRERVTWRQDSVLTVDLPAAGFDAVVTHYLFDLFPPRDQERLLQTGLKALAPGGLWQDTEFLADAPGTLSHLRNRALLAASYRFLGAWCDFPARRLSEPRPLMEAARLQLQAEKIFGHLLSARLWTFPNQ